MIQTTHYCATCGSDHVRRNGSNNGQPMYQCTMCRHQGLFVPAAAAELRQLRAANRRQAQELDM